VEVKMLMFPVDMVSLGGGKWQLPKTQWTRVCAENDKLTARYKQKQKKSGTKKKTKKKTASTQNKAKK
jgi:hypothetical protein